MAQNAEKKHVAITVKRQFTIPKKYFDTLGFDTDAECTVMNGGLFIRPIKSESSEFSDEILADLIAQGFSGKELLARFKERTRKIRPAVELMIAEADHAAAYGENCPSLTDIFAADDK